MDTEIIIVSVGKIRILPLICETSNTEYGKICSFVNELVISKDTLKITMN